MYNLEAVSTDSFFTLHILNLVGITTPSAPRVQSSEDTHIWCVTGSGMGFNILPGHGLA